MTARALTHHKAINCVFQPYELKGKPETGIHNNSPLSAIAEEHSFKTATRRHMTINYDIATLIVAIVCHLAHIN
jgi:hypothetical protein